MQAVEGASLENTSEALSRAQREIERLEREAGRWHQRAVESPTRETLLDERDEINRKMLLQDTLLEERDVLNRSLLVVSQERDEAHQGMLLARRERDHSTASLQSTSHLVMQLEEVTLRAALCGMPVDSWWVLISRLLAGVEANPGGGR